MYPKSMILTDDDQKHIRNATSCHICKTQFTSQDVIVRDHCHFTGQFNGVAHSQCNLKYKDLRILPVVFHNLTNYDAHFLIQKVAEKINGSLKVLATTVEKYITIVKYIPIGNQQKRKVKRQTTLQLKFIDSYRFLNTGLDNLAKTLNKCDMKILRSNFNVNDEEEFDLLSRKGVFPYEYINEMSKLNETQLPVYDAFFSKLNGCNITHENYEHAQKVWQKFNIQTIGEYSDLYLKIDVLLLADLFEAFRFNCRKSYDLDPLYYYTLPGYSWDVMLKYTEIKLQLLTDIDMLLFIERGIRGGLSQCSHRYACANNEYMNESYDKSKETSYLIYFDVNNLYGWAMSQALPYRNFHWMENVDNFNVEVVSNDSPVGYILEVDLEYPPEIHDYHSDLPFCPLNSRPPNAKKNRRQNYLQHCIIKKSMLFITAL